MNALSLKGGAMPERKYHKVGDIFTMPMSFQLMKILGHEDRIYYLCAPLDKMQKVVCLKDPFFVICPETDMEGVPHIPVQVLDRAIKFVKTEMSIDEEDELDEDITGDTNE